MTYSDLSNSKKNFFKICRETYHSMQNFILYKMAYLVLTFVAKCSIKKLDRSIEVGAQNLSRKWETTHKAIKRPQLSKWKPNSPFCREWNSASNGMSRRIFWKTLLVRKLKIRFLKSLKPVFWWQNIIFLQNKYQIRNQR